jgi:hypothetical protein
VGLTGPKSCNGSEGLLGIAIIIFFVEASNLNASPRSVVLTKRLFSGKAHRVKWSMIKKKKTEEVVAVTLA